MKEALDPLWFLALLACMAPGFVIAVMSFKDTGDTTELASTLLYVAAVLLVVYGVAVWMFLRLLFGGA